LISTVAPAFSRAALIFSASFLPTPSLTFFWRALDEIFRFLQPEAGEQSDFNDDFELHLAGGQENDREPPFSAG
jgi:hypothetical protein